MKTEILESPTPAAPEIEYPVLMDSHGTIALAWSATQGVLLTPGNAFGRAYVEADSVRWTDAGYKPITAPITIRFTP